MVGMAVPEVALAEADLAEMAREQVEEAGASWAGLAEMVKEALSWTRPWAGSAVATHALTTCYLVVFGADLR
jgi:hypothetical protein